MRKGYLMAMLWRRKAGLGMPLTHALTRRLSETPRTSSSCIEAPLLTNNLELVSAQRNTRPVGVGAHWVAQHPHTVPLWNFLVWIEVHSRPRTHSPLWYHHCMAKQHLKPWENHSAAIYGASWRLGHSNLTQGMSWVAYLGEVLGENLLQLLLPHH